MESNGTIKFKTKAQNPLFIGEVTAEQIEEWKKDCPDGIYLLKVDGHGGYFRDCTRHDVNKSLEAERMPEAKPLDGVTEFGRLCYLGGNDLLLKKDKYFLSIAPDLRGKMTPLETILVNL